MSEIKDPLPDRLKDPAAAPSEAARDDASAQALADALHSSFFIIKILMVVLVIVFLGSGFFTVDPQEKAIILRFGKPVGEDESALLNPGPHWAFPYPIDEVVRIPVGEVQTVSSTIGWYYTTPVQEAARNEPPPGNTLNPLIDGYLLTGDANIVHARASLRYRISEPGLRYMFDFATATNLVKNALNNALLHAAARSTVEITRDSTAFREKASLRLEQLIEEQDLGITVDQLTVQVTWPRQLDADFKQVIEAEIKRSSLLTDARNYETENRNKARSSAKARVNIAEAKRNALVEEVAAEAKRFTDLLPEYRKDPQLFMDLIYAEALTRIYTNVSEKIVLQQRPDGHPRELRLLLSKEPPKAKSLDAPSDSHDH